MTGGPASDRFVFDFQAKTITFLDGDSVVAVMKAVDVAAAPWFAAQPEAFQRQVQWWISGGWGAPG